MQPPFNPYHTKGTVIFSRLRRSFLGTGTPGWFTRINCNVAILYFIYVFGWALAVFIAFQFGQNLPKAKNWNELFEAIGAKYQIPNIHFAFSAYLLTMLLCSLILLIGVMLVWRTKMKGFYWVFTALVILEVTPFLLLGMEFIRHEEGWWEFVIPGLILVLFLTDFLIRRKKITK